jgi:hypothetical protein
MLGPGADEPVWFWVGLTVTYPFAMTGGTLLVGESIGAPSANRGTAYLITTAFSLVGVATSAAIGVAVLDHNDSYEPDWFDEAMVGITFGAIPNAFLNAYVYNRVKKPATADETSRLSVLPYVTAYRVGRDEPTPVYGLTLTF